jgi:hypothetical protein
MENYQERICLSSEKHEEFPEFSKSDESGKGALFAAQNLFSTILRLGSTANPKLSACGGSNSWICVRYASLRIVSEKILTHAQSFLSRFLPNYSFKAVTRVF